MLINLIEDGTSECPSRVLSWLPSYGYLNPSMMGIYQIRTNHVLICKESQGTLHDDLMTLNSWGTCLNPCSIACLQGPAFGHWNVLGKWESLWSCLSSFKEDLNGYLANAALHNPQLTHKTLQVPLQAYVLIRIA